MLTFTAVSDHRRMIQRVEVVVSSCEDGADSRSSELDVTSGDYE
jgi:hypothetical protein